MTQILLTAVTAFSLVGCGQGERKPSGSTTGTTTGPTRWGSVAREAYQPVVGRYGGRIIFASISPPKSFNPITSGEMSTSEFTLSIFEGLTTVDAWTFERKPLLATAWEHDESGLVWTVKLREGVQWNDGKPFTADDVVFTYMDVIYNDDITTSMRDIITIEGKQWQVSKVDDFTVRFELPVKCAIFDLLIASDIVPKHKYQPMILAGTFDSAMGADSKPEDIVGTGPFMLASHETGQKVILRRNPRYWRRDAEGNRLPYLEEIIYVIVQDLNSEFLRFRNAETDAILRMRGEDFPILKPLEREGNFRIYQLGPRYGSQYVVFNVNPGASVDGKPYIAPYQRRWFSDVRFRQAVAHAIDRQTIIDSVMNGLGYPQYGPATSAMGYFYNPNIRTYDYNLDKARSLLRDMELIDRDDDGVLEDAEGHKVEFTLMTNAENNQRIAIAEIVRKDLEQLGMKANLRAIEFNALITRMDKTFDWEAILLGLTGGPEPHWGAHIWKSGGRMHVWYPYQKSPATPWEARIDEIFDQGFQELDRVKRKKLYDEWQAIIAEQQPYIYTAVNEHMVALRNKFGNVFPAPIGGVLHNAEEIFLLEP
ncbi:MAG TPA: ABC transporter substrate-binding protein [Phycisphaerae bacterium]|nr:ABC transporter substrate-binding protein [Phycisphaerae bacterium]